MTWKTTVIRTTGSHRQAHAPPNRTTGPIPPTGSRQRRPRRQALRSPAPSTQLPSTQRVRSSLIPPRRYGRLWWGSDSLGMPFTPPTFPDSFGRFPPTPFPPVTGFPQFTPVPGLFGFVPDQPTYGLFNLRLTPTGPVAPPSIAAFSAPQGPFGIPPETQPIPNFSSSPFSNPAFQIISGFTDQLFGTSASGNPLGLASTLPLKLPMVGSFSSLGPTALLPTDFSAPPIANPQSVSEPLPARTAIYSRGS